jgi:hypothetical protein
MSASCTGRRKSPQYHEMRENKSSDAAKDAGNAKVPNVFLRAG